LVPTPCLVVRICFCNFKDAFPVTIGERRPNLRFGVDVISFGDFNDSGKCREFGGESGDEFLRLEVESDDSSVADEASPKLNPEFSTISETQKSIFFT